MNNTGLSENAPGSKSLSYISGPSTERHFKMCSDLVCIDDFEQHAKRFLPKLYWKYYSSGASAQISLEESKNAFKRYRDFGVKQLKAVFHSIISPAKNFDRNFFYVHASLKILVLPVQSLKIFIFCLTFL